MNLADRAEQFLGSGIREVAGPSSHKQILDWIKRTEKLYPSDTPIDDSRYAWCGVFVGCMVLDEIAAGGKLPKPPAYFQGAKRWENWGTHILKTRTSSTRVERGDVIVTTRPGGHHVTIVSAVAEGGCICTGGNQSNMVSKAFYPWSVITAVRRG